MKVTYLHQYFMTPDAGGGTRSYEFARRLVSNGHEVCMITSSSTFNVADKEKVEEEIKGLSIVVIDVPYSNNMPYWRRILAFFKFAFLAAFAAMRRETDVIFATSTPLTIVIPAIFCKLWRRKPMVFEVRDLWPELPIAIGALPNPVLQWLASGLEWVAYHSSAHVVALSPGMADGVVKRGIPEERVTVVPNSCDIALFDVPPEQGNTFRMGLPGVSEGQPLVVYTGTFGLINGVSYLVEVASKMKEIAPEVRFLLVGDGLEKEKATQLAEKYGVLNSTLWILDSIPKKEMPNLLSAATLCCSLFIPLKEMRNNSANKFFDALSAGKPVAINYGGWQAELLHEYQAGIVLPEDNHLEAAKMIAELVYDSIRLEQASNASASLARTHFSRDEMAKRVEKVLSDAVHDTYSEVVTGR